MRRRYYIIEKHKGQALINCMETTGFGLGVALGMAVGGKIVASALGVALMATPVGWVLVIGVGITAGYFAAKGGYVLGKGLSGFIYDRDISWKSFNGG